MLLYLELLQYLNSISVHALSHEPLTVVEVEKR